MTASAVPTLERKYESIGTFSVVLHGWSSSQTYYYFAMEHDPSYQTNNLMVVVSLAKGRPIFNEIIPSSYGAIQVSPDRRYLAHNSKGGVTLRDTQTGKVIHKLSANVDGIMETAFSGDSQYLAGVGGDHDITVWNTSTGKVMQTLRVQTGYEPIFFQYARRLFFLTPGNRYLVLQAGKQFNADQNTSNTSSRPRFPPRSLTVWDIATGERKYTWQLPLASKSHCDGMDFCPCTPLGYLSENQALFLDDEFRMVRRLNWQTGGSRVEVAGVADAKFGQDAKTLLLANLDGSYSSFDLVAGKERILKYNPFAPPWQNFTSTESLFDNPERIDDTAWVLSKDGKYLATLKGNRVSVWQLPKGRLLAAIKTSSTPRMQFSPDNSRLALIGEFGELEIWRLWR